MTENVLDRQVASVEKRLSRRAKMSQMIRVRPSDPDGEHFEELPVTANVSKHGIYFHTNRPGYLVGMRLFITYPFTFVNDPMRTEYLAEVLRVDAAGQKRVGVAVRLLMRI